MVGTSFGSEVDVINKFCDSNKALLMAVSSYVTSFNQSECFISAQHCYATLKFVYDIDFWLSLTIDLIVSFIVSRILLAADWSQGVHKPDRELWDRSRDLIRAKFLPLNCIGSESRWLPLRLRVWIVSVSGSRLKLTKVRDELFGTLEVVLMLGLWYPILEGGGNTKTFWNWQAKAISEDFFKWPRFLYFRLFITVDGIQMFYINICQWLDSNRGPVVSEATALPTEPQPLPKKF